MDCFVFPSIYAGLGIVAIEAQANGLPVVASDKVPKEAKVTELLQYVSLEATTDEWVKHIIAQCHKDLDRYKYNHIVAEAGYDIDVVTRQLEDIYFKLY